MSETGEKSGWHWAGFAAALLFFLVLWLGFMLGMLLGDCRGPGDHGCFAAKDLGLKLLFWLGIAIMIAAPFAEAKRRWWGNILLLASPFLLIAIMLLWPL